MKFLVTLLLLITTTYVKASDSIHLKEGDFLKGKFTVLANQSMTLTVRFPDQSERRLLHDVTGSQEFMFKAENDGNAYFIVTAANDEKSNTAYRIDILQHIPIEKQNALPAKLQSPEMQRFAEELQQESDKVKQKVLVDNFWALRKKEGTPLIEPSSKSDHNLVTFLWRGAKNNVILWGAPSFDREPLERLGESDIWFKTFDVRNDTLISYRFAPDVPTLPLDKLQQRRALLSTLQADPLNSMTYPIEASTLDKFNYSSVLALDKAPFRRYTTGQNNIPKGKLLSYSFTSKLLNNSRRIFVYFPANLDKENSAFLLAFFFDGKEYTEQVRTPDILDNLIAAEKIPPTIAVFIDNPSYDSRRTELPPNPAFVKMLSEELYPWITEQLNIQPQNTHTILVGSSYGGLAAAYIAGQYPHLFGNVLAMSGSFWWKAADSPSNENNYIARLYATMPKQNINFFLSAGRYEASRNGEFDILNSSRHLNDVLIAKGYPVSYKEYTTDHSYFVWQYILPEGLSTLIEMIEKK